LLVTYSILTYSRIHSLWLVYLLKLKLIALKINHPLKNKCGLF